MPSGITTVYITREVWKTVLMYSMSGRECLFLFGGHERRITHVTRIRNISRNGRTNAEWDFSEYRMAKKEIRGKGLKHIADGHSHVDECSLPHPSLIDVRNILTGAIELICFPRNGTIRAWKIGENLSDTLNNEIELVLI